MIGRRLGPSAKHFKSSLTLGVLLGAFSCSVDDGVLGGFRAGGIAGNGGGGRSSLGSETSNAEGGRGVSDAGVGGATVASCAESGPVVTIASGTAAQSYDACTNRIASNLFINALCSCGSATFGGYLRTRGFDSSSEGEAVVSQLDSGAAVGINDAYEMSGEYTDVGGSLAIAGNEPWQTTGYLKVRGDLRTNADATSLGIAEVGRNAWFGGDFIGLGSLSVGGELHYAGQVSALSLTAKMQQEEQVVVTDPCPCSSDERLPIGALIDDVMRHNDNESIGLSVDTMAAFEGPAQVVLQCGKYYVSRIRSSSDLTIEVKGKASLFVDDSIEVRGDLSVQIANGAEVDIFVRDGLSIGGTVRLGDDTRPSSGRLYVDGQGEIALHDTFIGNLYAPRARLQSSGSLAVFGAVFAGEYQSRGKTTIEYDRAILNVGARCTVGSPPLGSCTKCGGCSGGQACVDGACQACRTDFDCCGQSVCNGGSCTLLVMQ